MTGIRSFVIATAVAVITVGASTGTRAGESPAMAFAFAPPNWTGLYIGGALGARQTDSNLSINAIDENYFIVVPSVQPDFPACTLNPQPCSTGASFDSTAFRLAMYGGYNWQFRERWVAGIEGDWGWANNKSTESGFSYYQGFGAPDSSYTLKSNWDASVRARIGFLATPSLLVFVAGGASWLHTDINSNCGSTSCFPGTYRPSEKTQSTIWSGWTIGGGIEAMLDAHWIVRAEYRYTDYGTKSFMDSRVCSPSPSPSCGAFTGLNVVYDVSMKTQTAMVGLAYKFGPTVTTKH